MVYLDYAADTPADERVLAAFCETARRFPGNPNARHALGLTAKERLDRATARIASLLGVREGEIIYTSGATEANNLAVKGAALHNRKFGMHVVTTALEHSSVAGPVSFLQDEGFETDLAELDKNGRVDPDALRALLREDTVLLSVCLVDSETGVRQNLPEIAAVAREFPHCVFHVDATQAVGKLPVSAADADLLTFAPHKFYGLGGIGVLVRRGRVLLEPQMNGGLSASPYRSGTPPLPLIVSAEEALALALQNRASRLEQVTALNKILRRELAARPGVRLNSPADASPFILNLSLPGVKTEALQEALSARGVCVATKAACCAPGTVSRPVYALTGDRKAALSTLRLSLSHRTTEKELGVFLAEFDRCRALL